VAGGLMEKWNVYIIDKKGKLYVGITTDLENRKRQHGVSGLLYTEGPLPKSEALARERQLKGWSRKKKLSLISDTSSQQNVSLP
jgi:predicted GIY-YIG superfamily endonuclease